MDKIIDNLFQGGKDNLKQQAKELLNNIMQYLKPHILGLDAPNSKRQAPP